MKFTFTKLIALPLLFLFSFFSNSFAQAPADLFISEYVEGSSNNKALEFYNGTGSAIDLASGNYVIQMYFNGSTTVGTTISLTGTVANNSVFVLAQSSASFASSPFVNQTNGSSWYNGDDVIILRKGGAAGTIVDVIGQPGFDPGAEWGTGLVSTADNTLRRKAADCTGDINTGDVFDPAVKYDGFATDDFSGLGSHTSSCVVTGASISLAPVSLNFSTTPGTPSAEQTYTVQGNTLTNDITITAPALSSFGLSEVAGGPYSGSITITAAAANAGPVTVYTIFNPSSAGTQSGNISHVSGSATGSLAVQGTTTTSGGLTPIYNIQGTGSASLLDGNIVTTEGVVTADFQGATQLNGFFIQDTTGDGNSATSDGIFVFNSDLNVNVGDYVRLTAEVDEFFSKTELKNVTALTVLSSANTLMTPVTINLPVSAITDLESFEGMLVKFPQTLTVTETFTLGRFGEVSLSTGGRIFNPTNFVDPNDNPASGTTSTGTSNVAAVTAQQNLNGRSRILLDDGSTVQNPAVVPYLDPVTNTLRSGSTLTDLAGVLDYDFSVYRIQPTQVPAFNYAVRPTVPVVGGDIKVASFNVLNYFNGDGSGGGFPTERGAHTLTEFNRQRVKIINAIKELNADVIGLIEIENDGTGANSAIADLVNGLNAATASGTYAYILDPTGVNGNTGTDAIKQAIIYKPAKVTPVGLAIADMNAAHNRPPVAQTFTVNTGGEKFTFIVTHFKSKSCTGASGANADQLDGQGCYNASRKLQANALLDFITSIQSSSADPDVISVGDYNAYEQEDPMDILNAGGLVNILTGTYSYVFDGQSGSLDHALVTSSLNAKISGANKWHINADEPIAKDYNQEFNPPYMYSPDAFRSSDHDPVLVGLNLQPALFTLQVLHGSDFEGGPYPANFAAIVDTLEGQYPNTVILSSGDNYIPSPFFNAGADRTALDGVYRNVYNQHFGPNTSNFLRAGIGRADLSVLNLIGFNASALGNHEFDAGTSTIAELIGYEISGTEIRWMGAQFPYLSANLDFSADAALSPLFTNSILPTTAYISRPDTLKSTSPKRKIAPASIINVNDEKIGLVGATTQILESISSTGGVKVKGSKTDNMTELAAYLQPYIDSLTVQGVNKIILLAHLQQIALEKELIGLLNNVDIVIAGGSSTLLADANDVLRAGDVAAGDYPYVTTNASGQPALVLNTDQEYKYVGRLVVDFDAAGVLALSSLNPAINGVYATTDQTVINLWGSINSAFAPGTKGNRVKTLVDAVNGVIIAKDGNIVGKTNVFLEGRRTEVRTQETNLGNISSDANISIAKQYDPNVLVSIKNGGGIRASIGEIRANPSTGVAEELPPQANPLSGKLAGEISQLDVENALRFNNSLSLVTVTPAQLLQVLNHGVAAVAPGATPGQFTQVGGIKFSYDPSLAAGSRVRNAVIIDSVENVLDTIAINGAVQGDPSRSIRVVTLTFLLTGGDSYPFNTFIAANPAFANRIDLVVPGAPKTGNAVFTDNGSEQDAFAEYLSAKYSSIAYDIADTDMNQDRRIQNLAVRNDSVLGNQVPVVTIINPVDGAAFNPGNTISLQAQASDAGGNIVKVEFYNAGIKFAVDSTAPYEYIGNGIEAGNYVLTAKAFDNSGDSTVSDTVRITVTDCTGSGTITAEGFANIPGPYLFNLGSDIDYPNNPDVVVELNKFEYGPNLDDNYGGRVRGYICAPQTGNYIFYLASNDHSELYLSTDENPANAKKIAYVFSSSVNFRSWFANTTQRSVPIRLIKGVRYYIETIHKESTGQDHLSVGWVLPNGVFEAPIPGSRLSPLVSSAPIVGSAKVEFGAAMRSASAKTKDQLEIVKGLEVTATPNPSQSHFTLTTKSTSNEVVTVTVTDIMGRVVETRSNILANGAIRFGDKYSTGIYFVEVKQGEKREMLKLVKK